ncbi:MAG: IPT/TIG domain-containing protein [Candidatus Binatia bacterium]
MHRFVAVVVVMLASSIVSIRAAAATPHITSVTPASGPTAGGIAITLTGEGFGAAGNFVIVGGSPCPVTAEAPEQIVCTLPAGSGVSRPIRAVDGSGTASPPFPYGYEAPTVTDVTAARMPTAGGVVITITGSNFGDGALDRRVRLRGASADAICAEVFPAAAHTTLTCTLPPGEGQNVEVDVLVDGQTSAPGALSYDAPVITEVSPSRAPAASGFPITIRGENFGLAAAVTVGGASCPVLERSHTEVSCRLPSNGVAPLEVRLEAGGQASNAEPFSYQMIPTKCDAAKFKAAGTAAQCLAKVYTKALQKGLDPDRETLTKCQDKFRDSCIKAETKLDDCTNITSCTETQAGLVAWVETVWNKQCVEKDTSVGLTD